MMSAWESSVGASDEWYTPKYIFDAMGARFDLDVANAAIGGAHVPCDRSIGSDGLQAAWEGFVWMNPPFGGRNGLVPWLDKFFAHGNGVALTPDRTSAPWWQRAARAADAVLFIDGKVKFERPDGSVGKQPSTGTTLFAVGALGVLALDLARNSGLGHLMVQRGRVDADLVTTEAEMPNRVLVKLRRKIESAGVEMPHVSVSDGGVWVDFGQRPVEDPR